MIPDFPDYCEALIGYRQWRCFPNGLLIGVAQAEAWPPYQALQAKCMQASSYHLVSGEYLGAPIWGCNCGIHALKTAQDFEQYRANGSGWGFHYDTYPNVWGSVRLWGRVIEHTLGYRAQFAYPRELFTSNQDLVPILEKVYGVPTTLIREEKESLENQGIADRYYWTQYSPTLRAPQPNSSTFRAGRRGGKTQEQQDWRDILSKMIYLPKSGK